MKACIICLSPLSEDRLEVVLNKTKTEKNSVELYSVAFDEAMNNWARTKGIEYKQFSNNSMVSFVTPVPGLLFNLPEVFSENDTVYFTAAATISSDNYLIGCIYNLSSLLKLKNINDINFSKELLELYLYFRQNTFFLFAENNLLEGNAWEIDAALINSLRLNKNRLYKDFFKTLLLPTKKLQGLNDNISIIKANTSLFSSSYLITSFNQKGKEKLGTFTNGLGILFTLINNKVIKPVLNKNGK
ncbi:hypothetical protein [Ferruginibacter albus]|uniref:hypothetical protein n=1 Tax=Ferruginibacter albus TaxID=2875540 RepID=UPI001CC82315|nr:hypothetical protein [Ferruginibacter albus]UAY50684.1 hypothetical protein K9M53_08760 [Ferruginibacter albus]